MFFAIFVGHHRRILPLKMKMMMLISMSKLVQLPLLIPLQLLVQHRRQNRRRCKFLRR